MISSFLQMRAFGAGALPFAAQKWSGKIAAMSFPHAHLATFPIVICPLKNARCHPLPSLKERMAVGL
jgi:hypothetical protein